MSVLPSPDPAALPVAATAHELYERNARRIFGYCLNRLGSREDAEDAVQSTFLNAFRALRRGVVPQAETAWLFKIADNVCRERHRTARRRPEEAHDPSALERAASPLRADEELHGLSDALARMAPRQRQALLLREWQGLSYREIAEELKLSPAAVETLIFRARRSLAQNLDSPERLRSRLRVPGLQVGSLLGWLKSLLPGGAAATKVAAAGVVVAGAALAGGAPTTPAPDNAPASTGDRPPIIAPAAPAGGGAVGTEPAERPRAQTAPRGGKRGSEATSRRTRERAGTPSLTERPGGPTVPAAREAAGPAAGPDAPTAPALAPTPPLTPVTPAVPPPPAVPQLPQLPPLPPPPGLPQPPELPKLNPPALPAVPPLPPAPPLPPPLEPPLLPG